MLRQLDEETRKLLAEYHVLNIYDRARRGRYGDTTHERRWREISRRGDALIDAGVPIDSEGNLPRVAPEELVEAFERVLRRRYRRWLASVRPWEASDGTMYERWTKHARGTERAWAAVAKQLRVTL